MFGRLIKFLFSSNTSKQLINFIAIIAVSIFGYYQAYNSGYQTAKLECEIAKNQVVQTQLLTLDEQIKRANMVNLDLTENLGLYQRLGDKTTDELQKILAKTQHLRRHCQFDINSMRELNTARNRAAKATTGGLADNLPVTGTTSRK
ncbi:MULTISPECIES: hypothetical protein [Actinobacillus]|uniref:hypothetical protein n=1 Tax=Actinobacillus TaxID=713 RepID=UPI001FCAAADC|nr:MULTISPECIES: hypothetical protein [Actinobacillus]WGE51143.1 hypothetical protein NYR68_01780 [Actinobacillus equuli subsp. haemolyticus]WGE65593.1 hypothetical protein NYR76_01135 [Actinobacillus equuli subsp. equuli]WGE83705.1 hypothetical protein NYR86_00965 [Actinobacillus equuli subsp. equuli]